jgi:hypothetical protein
MAHFFVHNRAQGPRYAAGRRPVAMATLKIVAFIAKSNKYFAGELISWDYSNKLTNSYFLKGGVFGFFSFLWTLFNTASSAAPQIPQGRMWLGSNSRLMQLWHWPPDALTTRLGLIRSLHALFFIDHLHLRPTVPSYCWCKRLFQTEDVKKMNN